MKGKLASIKNKILSEVEIYCLLIVIAVWYLTNLKGGLNTDEVVYANAGHSLITLQNILLNLEHPPLAKYFIGLGQLLFGTTSFGARLPIAIFGLLTIYMTYRVGKLLGNRFVGFASAFLLSGTCLFAQFSVMAMLDVPLAFFSITLLFVTLKYLKADDLSPKYSFLVGFLSILTIASKYYGIFFAIIPLIYLLLERWRKYGLSHRLLFSLNYYLAGGLLSFILVYAPYIFTGNLVYVFREAYVYNFQHLASGNLIMVGATVYQYPPFWSYLYWLWEEGGWIYTLGLLISLCYIAHDAIKSKEKVQPLLLISFALIPLCCISLISVKFTRYLIPLLPIFVVCLIPCLFKLLDEGVSKLPPPFRSYPALFASIGILLLLFTPTSPLLTSFKCPIAEDSGYDKAAKIVEEYAKENTDREVRVVSWYANILAYYLNDTGEGIPNIDIMWLSYGYEEEELKIEEMINEGKVDIVIDYEPNERFTESHLYNVIREKAKYREKINLYEEDLVIFRF